MPAPWTQEFDYFIGHSDGDAMAINLDMAAENHLPLGSHPTVVEIRVVMKRPNEYGLRSDEEFGALIELEDALVAALKSSIDAIYAGRAMYRGAITFAFYTAPQLDGALLDTILDTVTGEYDATVTSSADPAWSWYHDRLPNDYQKQLMANRQLQQHLEELGDNLAKRRIIDHAALFHTADLATQAASALKKAKFSVDRVQGPDETGTFLLEFHRKDACNDAKPDRITDEILDIIEPLGGAYDGWGCAVRT
jgi:regulator of RNase E activity RraB